MRNVTKENITETFTGYFGDETDPRLKFVLSKLAEHLHDFVRDTELTHDEWRYGLEFLQRVGEITTPERNEYVLLSDVLGLSSLVDMMHSPDDATSSSVLGPFHVAGSPPLAIGGDLKKEEEGEVVLFEGRVLDPEGKPVADAEIDLWQTASNGLYSSQDEAQDIYNFHGLIKTDARGYYAFTTVRPVPYTVPSDGPVGEILNATGRHPWRPSHMHYIVKAEGFQTLVTEVFPVDDPYLDNDTVFGVRSDLIMEYVSQPAGSFPDGLELSGKVDGPWSKVEFDLRLSRAENGAAAKADSDSQIAEPA